MTTTTNSLPNRYRPEKFSDLRHQKYAEGVGYALGAGKRMQGYILAGPMGCGKTTLARIIASAVNADALKDNGDPVDDNDVHVRAVFTGTHPDVKEINAADNRGIDDMRDLIKEMVSGVPHKVKVFIIDEAHKLTQDAFISLLKPIEEPPENVMFILCTTSLEAIPETIISRLPVIPILPFNPENLAESVTSVLKRWAEEDGVDIEDPAGIAADIAPYASGSLRTALTMAENRIINSVDNTPPIKVLRGIVEDIISGDTETAVREVVKLHDDDYDPRMISSGLMTVIVKKISDGSIEDNWRIVEKMSEISTSVEHSFSPVTALVSGIALTAEHKNNENILIEKLMKKIDSINTSTVDNNSSDNLFGGYDSRKNISEDEWDIDNFLDEISDINTIPDSVLDVIYDNSDLEYGDGKVTIIIPAKKMSNDKVVELKTILNQHYSNVTVITV